MEMDPRVHPIRHLMVTTSMNQSSSFSIDSRTVTCTRPYHRTLDHPRVCVSIQNNGWFKRSSLKTTYSSLLRPDLYFMSFLKYQNTMNIEFRDCKFYSPLDFPLQIGVGLDSQELIYLLHSECMVGGLSPFPFRKDPHLQIKTEMTRV